MKALLMEFAVGTSSKTSTIRKITPVSADVPAQKSLSDTQLQVSKASLSGFLISYVTLPKRGKKVLLQCT